MSRNPERRSGDAGLGLRRDGGAAAISCPLCHGALAGGEERAHVPVSPVVYPGVDGLDVHARCLRAARLGAFERPPRGTAAALVARLRVR